MWCKNYWWGILRQASRLVAFSKTSQCQNSKSAIFMCWNFGAQAVAPAEELFRVARDLPLRNSST